MAQPDFFRFYIMLDELTFIYIDSFGNIQTTTDFAIGIANPLRYSVDEWQDIEQGWTRSESTHGIITKITGQYTFKGDGAKILKHIIFTEGYTAVAKFRIDKLNTDALSSWNYSVYQEGDISFETPKTNMTDAQIKLYETGIGQDFKQNLTTKYEIDSTGQSLTVYFVGTTVKASYNYRYGNTTINVPFTASIGLEKFFNLPLSNTNNEGYSPVATAQSEELIILGDTLTSFFYGATEYSKYGLTNQDTQTFVSPTLDVNAMDIEWQWDSGTATPVTAKFALWGFIVPTGGDYTVKQFVIFSDPPIVMTSGVPYVINIPAFSNFIPDISPDENLYISAGINIVVGSATGTGNFRVRVLTPETSGAKLTFPFKTAPSEVDGLRQPDIYRLLMDKVADGKYGLTPSASNFLNDQSLRLVDNYPYHTILTNGLELKGVKNTIYTLSPQDLLDHLQALYPVGIGVKNNVISLEHLSEFYRDDIVIADLGVLTDVEVVPTNKMGTTLKFGYDYEKGDILNGVDDYNTATTLKTQGRFENDKPIEFISPATASVYEIEQQRVEQAGKDTTGTRINDKLFCFSVYPTPSPTWFLNIPDEQGGVVTGVLYPDSAYNVDLSPRRNIERLLPLLNSWAYPSTKEVKFQLSDRSAEMVSKFRDSISPPTYFPEITEKTGFTPSNSPLLWLPFEITCKAIVPIDIVAAMEANPYGVFIGTYKGYEVRFFADSVKFKPKNRNTFEFVGRLSPTCDLTPFKQ